MPGESKTSENRLQALDRARRALELRRAGVSFPEIATTLQYASASGAYQAVMKALKRTLQEPADEVRRLEVERLDRLLLGVWKAAISGDTDAIDRVLKISHRRAQLLGLDVKRHEHTGRNGTPIEIKHVNVFDRIREFEAAYSSGAAESALSGDCGGKPLDSSAADREAAASPPPG